MSKVKKDTKKKSQPMKLKIDVMDDLEEVESDIEKKIDDDIVDTNDIDEETIVGSDYDEEGSDEDVELSDEENKIPQQPMSENLHDTEYYRSINIVPDQKRITSDIMTMFEFSEVIGIRTSQIEKGSPVFTEVSELHDPYDMAIKELFDRKSPLKIIRRTLRYEQEEWKCNEMGFPFDIRSAF